MATSKTLTPTNVTISIPAMTDAPDQRVNSNCIDKEADAINATDAKLGNYIYTAIAENANLDNITTPGNYGVQNNTIASSLTNCPTSIAFTMEVKKRGSYLMQIIDDSNGNLYVRNQSSGGWGDWSFHTGSASALYSVAVGVTVSGSFTFNMPNLTQALVLPGAFAPINVGMSSVGALYYSTLPSGLSLSQSGSNVTITKSTTGEMRVAVFVVK